MILFYSENDLIIQRQVTAMTTNKSNKHKYKITANWFFVTCGEKASKTFRHHCVIFVIGENDDQ